MNPVPRLHAWVGLAVSFTAITFIYTLHCHFNVGGSWFTDYSAQVEVYAASDSSVIYTSLFAVG
jgi:hypothetical protein